MLVSYRWLQELCPVDADVAEVAHRISLAGLEVEAMERKGERLESVVIAEREDPGGGQVSAAGFFDTVMMVCLRRHLRQVGNAQHLPFSTQQAQFLADDFRHATAYAAVDLVEYQGRNPRRFAHDDLDRQADTREFAAGGNPGEGFRRMTRIGADQVTDIVDAVCGL